MERIGQEITFLGYDADDWSWWRVRCLLVALCIGYTTRSALIGVTGREGGALQITSLTVAANLAVFGGPRVAWGTLLVAVLLTRRVLCLVDSPRPLASACWIVSPLALVCIAASVLVSEMGRTCELSSSFLQVLAVANVAVGIAFWLVAVSQLCSGIEMDGPIKVICDGIQNSGFFSREAILPLAIEILWHGAIPTLGFALAKSSFDSSIVDLSLAASQFVTICGIWASCLFFLSMVLPQLRLPYFLPCGAFGAIAAICLSPLLLHSFTFD